MMKTKFAVCSTMMLSLLLSVSAAAQDAGQFLILSAQYGSERNHVDVTNRLKDLARRDQPFRITFESMAVDPDHGQAKMLRVFARGPNGQERNFDFPDGSAFDGSQFRSWGRGDWGDEHWTGGWQGRPDNVGGQYVILTAQYGNESRHVDVTNRLKELARQDRVFRLDPEASRSDEPINVAGAHPPMPLMPAPALPEDQKRLNWFAATWMAEFRFVKDASPPRAADAGASDKTKQT